MIVQPLKSVVLLHTHGSYENNNLDITVLALDAAGELYFGSLTPTHAGSVQPKGITATWVQVTDAKATEDE